MPTVKEIIRDLAIAAYRIGSVFIPVKDDVILFESSNGRNYTGNPRYIYEEMVKQGLDKKYKCIWSKDQDSNFSITAEEASSGYLIQGINTT